MQKRETSRSRVRAVPFLDVTTKDSLKYSMQINRGCVEIFDKIKKKQLGVVSVLGGEKSGKSLLANRLCKTMRGMEEERKGRGVAVMEQPVKLGDEEAVLVLETFGMHFQRDSKEIEEKVLALVLLLSSTLVFNCCASESLEHQLQALGRLLDLPNQMVVDGAENNEALLLKEMPRLIIVLRDFSGGQSKAEDTVRACLENRDAQGHRCRLLRRIGRYFPDYKVLAMVKPVGQTSRLQKIFNETWEDLRPEFREDMKALETLAFTGPKKVLGNCLDGTLFSHLVQQYLDCLNSNQPPNIKARFQ